MLTPEQHYDELVLQHFWDAQSNRLALCSSILGLCSNTLTQRRVGVIPTENSLHSSCTGRAFYLHWACILNNEPAFSQHWASALEMHKACTIAELGTCILVALGRHSSCAHRSLHPCCVLAFWLHGACILTAQGQHSNCMGPTFLRHACIPQWLH